VIVYNTNTLSSFLDSQNSLSFLTLSYALLAMTITGLFTCCFRTKCREISFGCCKINRDIDAENTALEIENAHRDRIPPPSNV
jgi:hypothetical protein